VTLPECDGSSDVAPTVLISGNWDITHKRLILISCSNYMFTGISNTFNKPETVQGNFTVLFSSHIAKTFK